MNIWSRLTSPAGSRKSSAADGLTDTLYAILTGGLARSRSGARVNLATAMRVRAVFACVRVISEGCAQVPFKVFREQPSPVSVYPQRLTAADHPLYDLLHRRPNSWQTSFEFRETMVMHALLGKGAFAFKSRSILPSRGNRIEELILIDPGCVTTVQNSDWSLTYKVRGKKDGQVREYSQDMIWHLRGPSWDGVNGLDVIDLAREAIGLSITTEESQAKLHEKGVRTSGAYSVDAKLDDKQYKQLKSHIEQNFAGAENAGAAMILDNGAKWINNAMTGVDAQHLETRRNQVEEVCSFFRVLPIMIGFADKTMTFASAEQMFIAHVVHTLMPWYERIQQSADVNLLTASEREQGYYTKLVETGLLRGALKDTGEFLAKITTAGIMARNEARAKLDMNPLEGLDEPLTPTNMTTDPSGAVAEPSAGA